MTTAEFTRIRDVLREQAHEIALGLKALDQLDENPASMSAAFKLKYAQEAFISKSQKLDRRFRTAWPLPCGVSLIKRMSSSKDVIEREKHARQLAKGFFEVASAIRDAKMKRIQEPRSLEDIRARQ